MPTARKRPQQRRSEETVARIVDAAARVLADDGYQAASTNRIARDAGVSPGTLYQYFAEKDEIVAAIVGRIVDGLGEAVAPALRAAATQEPADGARAVLHAALAHIMPRAPLLDAVVDRVPAERYAAVVRSLRARVVDVTFQLLVAQLPTAAVADLERRAWMIVTIAEQVSIRYAVESPGFSVDELVDELATALVAIAAPPA